MPTSPDITVSTSTGETPSVVVNTDLGRRSSDQGVFSGHPTVRMFAQFGFAGLVAVIFYQMFQNDARTRTEQSRQIYDMVRQSDDDRRETAKLFREELRDQRGETKAIREDLLRVSAAMDRAVTALTSASVKLETGVRAVEKAAESVPKESQFREPP